MEIGNDLIIDQQLISDKLKIVIKENKNEDVTYNKNSSLLLALIISSEARLFMLEHRLNPKTAYTDTDSIFINGDLDNSVEIHKNKIGAFKLECKIDKAYFIKKKTYAYKEDKGNEIVKAAGIPKNLITYDQMEKLYHNNQEIVVNFKKMTTENYKISLG